MDDDRATDDGERTSQRQLGVSESDDIGTQEPVLAAQVANFNNSVDRGLNTVGINTDVILRAVMTSDSSAASIGRHTQLMDVVRVISDLVGVINSERSEHGNSDVAISSLIEIEDTRSRIGGSFVRIVSQRADSASSRNGRDGWSSSSFLDDITASNTSSSGGGVVDNNRAADDAVWSDELDRVVDVSVHEIGDRSAADDSTVFVGELSDTVDDTRAEERFVETIVRQVMSSSATAIVVGDGIDVDMVAHGVSGGKTRTDQLNRDLRTGGDSSNWFKLTEGDLSRNSVGVDVTDGRIAGILESRHGRLDVAGGTLTNTAAADAISVASVDDDSSSEDACVSAKFDTGISVHLSERGSRDVSVFVGEFSDAHWTSSAATRVVVTSSVVSTAIEISGAVFVDMVSLSLSLRRIESNVDSGSVRLSHLIEIERTSDFSVKLVVNVARSSNLFWTLRNFNDSTARNSLSWSDTVDNDRTTKNRVRSAQLDLTVSIRESGAVGELTVLAAEITNFGDHSGRIVPAQTKGRIWSDEIVRVIMRASGSASVRRSGINSELMDVVVVWRSSFNGISNHDVTSNLRAETVQSRLVNFDGSASARIVENALSAFDVRIAKVERRGGRSALGDLTASGAASVASVEHDGSSDNAVRSEKLDRVVGKGLSSTSVQITVFVA